MKKRSRRYEAKDSVKAMLQERIIWRNLLHKYGTLQGSQESPDPIECCVRNTHAWFFCYTKNFFDILSASSLLFDVRIHKTHLMRMNKLFRKIWRTYMGSGVHVSGTPALTPLARYVTSE